MVASLRQSQQAFTAHVRDPQRAAPPSGIETRRMRIYQELVYNNLESFIRTGFPVLYSLIDGDDWKSLVRGFLAEHRAQSPYFLEISQEFLEFLQNRQSKFAFLPVFALELAHYEWIELALDVAPEDLPEVGIDPDGDLSTGVPVINPLAWSLAYQYPVHRISSGFQPNEPLPHPVFLVVYRNRADEVRFLEINSVTARLLELLREAFTGRAALARLSTELPDIDQVHLLRQGALTFERLRQLDILLGTAQPKSRRCRDS